MNKIYICKDISNMKALSCINGLISRPKSLQLGIIIFNRDWAINISTKYVYLEAANILEKTFIIKHIGIRNLSCEKLFFFFHFNEFSV